MSTELDTVLDKLPNFRKVGGQYSARCPAHDDHHNSLSIKEENGKVLLHCFAGCDYGAIAMALGLQRNGGKDISNAPPEIVATYDYMDSTGKLLYQVVRYNPKDFRQRRPDGKGGWIWNLEGVRPTLYRVQALAQGIAEGRWIFVVEGEKDVDNLLVAGQVATSMSGGANARWPAEALMRLRGGKVCVIPDNDEPGRVYGHYIASALRWVTPYVKMVQVPVGKDISDYLATATITDFMGIVEGAQWYSPLEVVTRAEFDTFTGFAMYLLKQNNILRKKPGRETEWE